MQHALDMVYVSLNAALDEPDYDGCRDLYAEELKLQDRTGGNKEAA